MCLLQIAFSYLWEQLSAFTRDYSIIRAALNKVEAFSKTCIETVLTGIKTVISDEWNHSSCQVTDIVVKYASLHRLKQLLTTNNHILVHVLNGRTSIMS